MTKKHHNVRITQTDPEDRFSWALYVNGRQTISGMCQSEAEWRKEDEIETKKMVIDFDFTSADGYYRQSSYV